MDKPKDSKAHFSFQLFVWLIINAQGKRGQELIDIAVDRVDLSAQHTNDHVFWKMNINALAAVLQKNRSCKDRSKFMGAD